MIPARGFVGVISKLTSFLCSVSNTYFQPEVLSVSFLQNPCCSRMLRFKSAVSQHVKDRPISMYLTLRYVSLEYGPSGPHVFCFWFSVVGRAIPSCHFCQYPLSQRDMLSLSIAAGVLNAWPMVSYIPSFTDVHTIICL